MSANPSTRGRMVSGAISVGLANVVGLGTGLGITILSTHSYPPATYGAYVLLLVVVGFLSQVSNFGMDLSVPKFLAGIEDDEYKRDFLGTAVTLRLAAIAICSVIAWAAAPLLSKLFGSALTPTLLVYMPVLFLLDSSRTLLKATLDGFMLFSKDGITDLLTSLINLLLLAGAVVLMPGNILGLVLARAGGLLLASLYAYFSIPISKKLVIRREVAKQLGKFGLPLQINDILNFIFGRIDTIVIGALLGVSDVALYEVARRIPDSLNQLYQPVRSVYFPVLSRLFTRGEKGKAARLLNMFTRLVSFGAFFGAAAVIVFGKDIVQLLFGDQYLPSVPAFQVLMVTFGVSLASNIMGTSLVAVGDSDKPAIVNAGHVAVSLVGSFLLIPVLGIMGAALVALAGPLLTNVLNLLFLRRRLEVKAAAFMKPLLILCAWAAAVLWLQPAGFPAKTGALAVYGLLCILLSVITLRDVTLLVEESGIASWSASAMRRVWPRSSRS